MELGSTEYIAIAAVLAALLGPLVTWRFMKRQFAGKKLAYSYSIEPIVKSNDSGLRRDLKIFYRDKELPDATLLSLEITNIGRTAIEDAEVVIQIPDATHLIPGYFVDTPTGYPVFWDIEQTNAEECVVRFKHINPKQTAKIRLLMDGMPEGEPRIACPMPNVECISVIKFNSTINFTPEIIVMRLLKIMRL